MSKVRIVIAGAGELGRSVGLLLVEHATFEATYFLGDKDADVARRGAEWITQGNTVSRFVNPIVFDAAKVHAVTSETFPAADLIIDCLPDPMASHVAQLARRLGSAYLSSTSSALENSQMQENLIMTSQPFLLHAGIAPGLATLLLKNLYEYYRIHCDGKAVDYAGIRVATLPVEAGPHSPEAGGQCAFLSCKEAILISNVRSSRKTPISLWECNEINGNYSDFSIMAGGQGNLVNALTDRIRQAAHPTQLRPFRKTQMRATYVSQDWLQVQAVIEGYNVSGAPITLLKSCKIYSAYVGRQWLSATQVCKAVLLSECVQLLLNMPTTGLIFLNQLDAQLLFSGSFIKRFFDIPSKPEMTYQRPATNDPSD